MKYWDIVVGHRLIVDPTGKSGHPWSGQVVIVEKDCGLNACPSIIPAHIPAFYCRRIDDERVAYFMPDELEPEVPSSIPDDDEE